MENWFEDWFDSPFYHLLYNHRDFTEAEHFIENLFQFLNPNKESSLILDLACGKGRHSIQLNQLGYDVVGLDLSEQSIYHAKTFENDRLHFHTADMRDFKMDVEFDIVLNLFTSFGYFKSHEENLEVFKTIDKNLSKNGRIVLDYLNVQKVVKNIPSEEKIVREGLEFNIKKKLKDEFIVKQISFNSDNKEYHFKEYVKAIDLIEFEKLAHEANFKITHIFGNYTLANFDKKSSDRLILIMERNVN